MSCGRSSIPSSTSRSAKASAERGVMIVYRGPVFSVEVDRRRFPNGAEHDITIVRHAPSVVLIPIEDDGRVVMVKQYRAPLDRDTWEFPAGSVDASESAEDAARRGREEEIARVPARI